MFAFTLRQLEYFVAACETGTLAAAARICHVSQAGIASAVSDLESELHAQLLLRQKAKGVTPTPEGEEVLKMARRILSEAGSLANIGTLGARTTDCDSAAT